MSSPYPAEGALTPYSPGYPAQSVGGLDCAALMRMATMGAIVGGSAAAAQRIRRAQAGAQTPTAALAQTGKAAVTAGLATAAAGAVASSVAEQGATRLGLMFLIGTAVVYGLQSRLGSEVDHE
ncbi:magnetosome protein MamC [Thiorhodococcus minor]|uniref:Uncharacterized protein n=1 Tax=Thiorhodococcus minor TaxID=57489 RepID=A0A6M0JYB8_9GAMM|nr:magnetosome protein MamC [Thiorhodococcus minor]NEV62500.1 hypothetical protein [Thiorhodococcus minor]